MANEVLIKNGVPLLFQSSVYVPTGNNVLTLETTTPVDLTLDEGGTGLSDAAAVNSDKVDLQATRAARYSVIAALEWFAAITAGLNVDFYWSPSQHSSAGIGNAGHPDGVDGAWTGDGGGTVAETVPQLQFIGSFITTDLQAVQIAYVGTFSPIARYGQLIVVNNSGTLLCGTDDIESGVLMTPLIDEVQ